MPLITTLLTLLILALVFVFANAIISALKLSRRRDRIARLIIAGLALLALAGVLFPDLRLLRILRVGG